jgi:hypothetical protein
MMEKDKGKIGIELSNEKIPSKNTNDTTRMVMRWNPPLNTDAAFQHLSSVWGCKCRDYHQRCRRKSVAHIMENYA